MIKEIALITFSYFLGSFPTGYVIGKVFYKDDVRKYGSGNIGMSNVFRTFGPLPALFTLIGDALKGYIPVILAISLNFTPVWISLVAFSSILGHVFSIYLKFKGGKGIATTFGIFFAINPWLGFIAVIVWILVLLTTRYGSLSSLSATFSSVIFSLILKVDIHYFYLFIAIFLLALYTHRSNIKRLITGEEFRLDQKAKRVK